MGRWLFGVALAALALAACGDDGQNGANGDRGPRGPEGPAGEAGAIGPAGVAGMPGGGYRWVDAAGVEVSAGSDGLVWDANGNAWAADLETGEVGAVYGASGLWIDAVHFEADNCDGPAWILPKSPRFVQTDNGALANLFPARFIVRPDDLVSEEVCLGSRLTSSDGVCMASNIGCAPMVRLFDHVSAGAAPEGFVGPLHPEPL